MQGVDLKLVIGLPFSFAHDFFIIEKRMDSSEYLMNIVVSTCQCRNVEVFPPSLSAPAVGLHLIRKGTKEFISIFAC